MKYRIITMDEVGNTFVDDYDGNNDFNFFCKIYNHIMTDTKFSIQVVSERFKLPVTDMFRNPNGTKEQNLRDLADFINNH